MAALGFTPASEQDVFSIEKAQSSCKPTRVLSGEEAKQFYENLIKDDEKQFASKSVISKKGNGGEQHCRQKNKVCSRRARRRVRTAETPQAQSDSVVQRRTNGESEGNQRRETNNSERSMELLGVRLLRCAHEGDISGLKDLLSKGVNINFQVQYLLLCVFSCEEI